MTPTAPATTAVTSPSAVTGPTAVTGPDAPDRWVPAREVLGVDLDLEVPVFDDAGPDVPVVDPDYRFDPDVTLAVLLGLVHDRRVLLQGRHGTGKSTHLEQVAARLGWPCVRVNLDGEITRPDLVGKDVVAVQDGRQVTRFQEGLLPITLRRAGLLVLDEYDAGRPDVLFVLQRVLEARGRFTLHEQATVLDPHPWFRVMATANTVGLGDLDGLYSGVRRLNQAQLDRWNLVVSLDYLPADEETDVVLARVPALRTPAGRERVRAMVAVAGLTRSGFTAGDLSTVMSPRTVISWAENAELVGDVATAFRLTFLNRCDPEERALVAEYFQRCFDEELAPGSAA